MSNPLISVEAANYYLSANIALVIACALLGVIRFCAKRPRQPILARHLLWLMYLTIVATLLTPISAMKSSSLNIKAGSMQIWAATTMNENVTSTRQAGGMMQIGASDVSFPFDTMMQVTQITVVLGVIVLLGLLALDVVSSLRLVRSAQTVRAFRNIRIVVSDRVPVPLAFWSPFRYWIVVPYALLFVPGDLRLAVHHEAQHHRQHDSKVRYLCELLRAAFFFNPAIHLLVRFIRDQQELACDEAVIGRKGVSAGRYCECLVRTAELALENRRDLVRLSMASGDSRMLAQRIAANLSHPSPKLHSTWAVTFGVAVIAIVMGASTVLGMPLQDRRINIDQGQRMAARAQVGSTFPITMNDSVLKELNRLLGTPDGHAHLLAALRRMEPYRQSIVDQALRYGVPVEVVAIPLVESGYRNLGAANVNRGGAGLWMFIPSTARHFGLQVNATVDERLDESAETTAAVKMLSALYAQFGDWNLALLAFNTGNAKVERGIQTLRTRDAWKLSEHGVENDPGYLARVMAVILIVNNPAVLN